MAKAAELRLAEGQSVEMMTHILATARSEVAALGTPSTTGTADDWTAAGWVRSSG